MGNFRKVFYGCTDNGMADLTNAFIKNFERVEILPCDEWQENDFDNNLQQSNFDCDLIVLRFVRPNCVWRTLQFFLHERMTAYEVNKPRVIIMVAGDVKQLEQLPASLGRRFELVHFKFGGRV